MKKINITTTAKSKHLYYFRIKGPKDYSNLIYYSFIKHHIENNYSSTFSEVINFKEEYGAEALEFFFDYLDRNFKTILIGKPNEILEIETQFYNKLHTNYSIDMNNKPHIDRILKLIFNYDKFVETKNSTWNPLLLSKSFSLSVCPYCNSQYTFTQFYNQNGRKFQIRPDLDHFFTQNTHPMLALSIYNLVPSCSICNSKLKHSKDSQLLKGIHPFIDNADKLFYFQRKIKHSDNNKVDFYEILMGFDEHFELDLIPTSPDYVAKVKGFEDMYQLSERYKPFNSIINKSIKRTLLYTHNYLQSLNQAYTFNDFSKNIIRTLNEVDSTVLSKVQNDIIKNEILPKMNSNLTK